MSLHSERLTSYVYKLDDFQRIHSHLRFDTHRNTAGYTLLLFKEASGTLLINSDLYPLRRMQIFLAPPGVRVHLLDQLDEQPLDGYQFKFRALTETEEGGFAEADLKLPHELPGTQFRFLINSIQEIERGGRDGSAWGTMRMNIVFYEMLLALFKELDRSTKPDADQGIELTVDYMERHYRMPLTREALAELAGLSADYYSRAFKKRMGQSPMDYLTGIRIQHAKQALLQSRDSYRMIAQNVGFSDEFYFSRRFKAETGMPPSVYVNRIKYSDRIASMKHLLTGHLLALGIEPYAAVINNLYPVTTKLHNTIAIGESRPELERLMMAKPDLIIAREPSSGEGAPQQRIFNQIAPTVTLPYYEDWRAHLQNIARTIGRTAEAGAWLDRYESRADDIRKRLAQRLGGQTVLIVGIGEGRMCIYGNRNIGSVLYGDLRLAVPEGIEHIAHFREVALEELHAFDADCILLTVYRHDGSPRMDQAIRAEVRRLAADQQWQSLRAVNNNQVYAMHSDQHLYTCYTSYTHNLLLDQMQSLFLS